MTMISHDDHKPDDVSAPFVFVALGGFWVLLAVAGWLMLGG